MEEDEEDTRKPWEIRYANIRNERLTKSREGRCNSIPKAQKAGRLSGGTKQKNVSTRRVNCSMCGSKRAFREIHDAGNHLYYCQGCAKFRGLI